MRRRSRLVPLLLAALLLQGCWDRTELEERAFVMAVAIDRGQEQRYAVTVNIALPAQLAGEGGGGGEGPGFLLTTVEAPTLTAALGLIDSYVDRQVSLLHAKAVFLGEEVARESGLESMDELVRFREARRTIFYAVTRGRAEEFLRQAEPIMEKSPHRFIEQMTYNYRQTGMVPASSQVQTFVTDVSTGYRDPMVYYAAIRGGAAPPQGGEDQAGRPEPRPATTVAGELPRRGGPNMEFLGAAAFRHDKMAGVLSGDEVRLVLMIQDEFQSGVFTLPDVAEPEKHISVRLSRSRPYGVQTDLSGDQPRFRGQIALEAELLAVQSGQNYSEPELQNRLERAFEEQLEREIRRLVRKTQEWGADIMGFGEHVAGHFPTVAAWEAYRWPERYPQADITVDVAVSMRRFGTQLGPPRVNR